MKTFLFRLSRLISVFVCFLFLISGPLTYLENGNHNIGDTLFMMILCSSLFVIPIIFNWLCFGKFTLWISKEVSE